MIFIKNDLNGNTYSKTLENYAKLILLEKCQRRIRKDLFGHLEKPKYPWLDKFLSELIDCTVPILRFSVPVSQERDPVKVELSCNATSKIGDGTRNTHLLLCYSLMDARVRYLIKRAQILTLHVHKSLFRPLVIVIKAWAEFHVLTGTRNGRLSGYSLVLMVIFYLQNCSPPVLPSLQKTHPQEFSKEITVIKQLNYVFTPEHRRVANCYESENKASLDELLLGFFRYYASEFDFHEEVISIREGKSITEEECVSFNEIQGKDPKEWFRYVKVEDPIYRYNVTRAIGNRDTWHRIYDTFRQSYNKYRKSKDLNMIFKS